MLYPLKFHPRLLPKMWGGRKLETILGKSLPPDASIGESWEIFDFPPGVIDNSDNWVSASLANGPLAGRTLHELFLEFGPDLHGELPLPPTGQFPLLIKFLDARDILSIQVHPDPAYCQAHPEAHLKSEAWYILQSDPGAFIYKGLKPGVTLDQFRQAVEQGDVEKMIRAVPVQAGDCHDLPSGTLHALGAGLLVAEVQTPSDTTFRAYDFNRVDPATGQTRTLHLEQALACIDFSNAAPPPPRLPAAGSFAEATPLCANAWFTIDKLHLAQGADRPIPLNQPVIWIMLEGQAEIHLDHPPHVVPLRAGETVLLPARMSNPRLKTLADCQFLQVTAASNAVDKSYARPPSPPANNAGGYKS